MGSHSARRSGAMTTVAGRGLFTATAAFALIGGSAGMAFAGEAPSHGHESSHGDHASHGSEHGSDHENDCEIPVVDAGSETVDATVNGATGGATAQALEAGNEAIAPVHDAVCPPASDILGPIVGETPAGDEDEVTQQAAGAASEDATSEESEDTASSATPASAITDIPAAVPAAS